MATQGGKLPELPPVRNHVLCLGGQTVNPIQLRRPASLRALRPREPMQNVFGVGTQAQAMAQVGRIRKILPVCFKGRGDANRCIAAAIRRFASLGRRSGLRAAHELRRLATAA